MSYDLEVRSDAHYSRRVSLDEARAIVEKLPGLHESGSAAYVLDRPDAGLHVVVDLCEGDEVDDVEAPPSEISQFAFTVAYPFLSRSGPVALEMAFQVAEALGWTVFDPQADAEATRASQSQALRWQGNAGSTARLVLERAVTAAPPVGEILRQELRNHRLLGAGASFVVAAVAAAWVLLSLGLPKPQFDTYFPLAASLGGLLVMGLKGALQAGIRLLRVRAKELA